MQSNNLHHWYGPTRFVIGSGCVNEIGKDAKRVGISSALLVTSGSISADSGIIQPVFDGLRDIEITLFDDVNIEKQFNTVKSAISLIEESAIDGIVSVGGGSTVDVARVISAMAVTDKKPKSLTAEINSGGEIKMSDIPSTALPVIAVPTTLSGAEVTCAAGVNIENPDTGTHQVRSAPMISSELWPDSIYYDPNLATRTPDAVLGPSAMNGLDHGIEMLYSRNSVPFTDATAAQGIRLLNESIPSLLGDKRKPKTLEKAMTGVALATTGLIDPTTGPKYSIIHSFGHQLAQQHDIHQGRAHGVVAPAVLDYIFEHTEKNQDLILQSLGNTRTNKPKEAITDRIGELRNMLGLPSELRSFDGIECNDIPVLAEAIQGDIGIQFGPYGLNPTKSEIREILELSW